MSAVVGCDWRPMTFKELLVRWETTLLETWMHTAAIRSCFAEKASLEDLHPYLAKQAGGKRIKIEPQKMFTLQTHRNGHRVSILDKLSPYFSSQ